MWSLFTVMLTYSDLLLEQSEEHYLPWKEAD
jgi:hypothetical protein